MAEPGIFVTRDEGRTWRRVAARGLQGQIHAMAAHPVQPDREGTQVRYGTPLSHDIVERRDVRRIRLPALSADYISFLAQSPAEPRVLAFASRRGDVYLTRDGGLHWRRIADSRIPDPSVSTLKEEKQ